MTRWAYLGDTLIFQAVKDVRASQDALVDLFGRMEYFFKRLEAYIEIRPTAVMTDIIVKIMVEVLSILGIVTKEIGQGQMSMYVTVDMSTTAEIRAEKYLKKLIGRMDIEDALRRLDQLTQEEARMAATELLKITRGIDDKVEGVDERVKGVDSRVGSVMKGEFYPPLTYPTLC